MLKFQYLMASSTATATATVAPTIGLFPNSFFVFLLLLQNIFYHLKTLEFQHLKPLIFLICYFRLLEISGKCSTAAHKLHTKINISSHFIIIIHVPKFGCFLPFLALKCRQNFNAIVLRGKERKEKCKTK